MNNINKKFLTVVFFAIALFSSCNKPSDPNMEVMILGSWELIDLMVDNQVVENYSNEFTLDIEHSKRVVFINHDGRGLTGTWSVESDSILTLTSDAVTSFDTLQFDIIYLIKDKMGLRQVINSDLLGTSEFTYFLEK
ncbi:MAG: hypothetical protein ACOCW8_01710 [bacterium]